MKIRPVGVELFHADIQTDMTKVIITFRNFSNAHKNYRKKSQHFYSHRNEIYRQHFVHKNQIRKKQATDSTVCLKHSVWMWQKLRWWNRRLALRLQAHGHNLKPSAYEEAEKTGRNEARILQIETNGRYRKYSNGICGHSVYDKLIQPPQSGSFAPTDFPLSIRLEK
jgi:hypothetical protein